MTIQFFSHWNGNDGIKTLAPAEETRLVAAGVARVYTPGMDGVSPAPVTAKEQPGGGVLLSAGGQPVSLQSIRSTAIKLATFGDSTANFGSPGNVHDTTVYMSTFPASGATVLGFGTLEKIALAYVNPAVHVVGNGGVSGETTAQMLARDAAGASTTRRAAADIVQLDPDVVLARCGSINDLTGVTAGTIDAVVAATAANHAALISRLQVGGALVIDEGIAGFANGTSGSATDEAQTRIALMRLNAIYEQAAAASGGRVIFLSPAGLTCDSSGAWLPYMSNDGRHLSMVASKAVADQESALIGAVFGARTRRYDGVNLVPNSNLSLTGSQAYGTVATGYAIGSSNATRQNARVEMIDGRPWQTCEFVTTAAGGQAVINLPFGLPSYGITATDVLGIEFDFLVQSLDGSALPSLNALLARLDVNNGTGRVVVDSLGMAAASSPNTSIIKGRVVFPPFLIGVASAGLTTGSICALQATMTTSGASIKLGVSGMRMVKV